MAKWQPKLSGLLSGYMLRFFQFTSPQIFLDPPLRFGKIYPQDDTIHWINPYPLNNSIDFGDKTTENQRNLLDFT